MIRVIPKKAITPSAPNREGFTLVEMLVSVALVMLMMSLFAQVFQVSSGMISNQKGLAKQDQDVRTMTILLQGDISQRTFRDVVPFLPGAATVPRDDAKLGFLSISENDPENGTDDVLHLTIKVDEGEIRASSPQLPFAGKATLIRFAEPSTGTVNPLNADIDDATERLSLLAAWPNQPEFDDGQNLINGTGTSRYAEICWFLRNGTLYRRQFLIREPYADASATSGQPADDLNTKLIPEDYTFSNVPPLPDASGSRWQDAVGRFWYDFDYSAFNDPQSAGGQGLLFHNVTDSLTNEHPGGNFLGSFGGSLPPSLGIPCLRFGNSIQRALETTPPGATVPGTPAPPPREFLNGTNPATYIGRFTMQETAHSAFSYPSRSPATGGPFQDTTALNLGSDGLVTQYSSELGRRGEDIVMTNVHSFDIQVWDDVLQRFVDLGHSQSNAAGTPGDYHVSNQNANSTFGNRYDTWHPNNQMPPPPYRPLQPDLVTPKRLRAIRIAIRFHDVGSDQIRDLTFTFPLND